MPLLRDLFKSFASSSSFCAMNSVTQADYKYKMERLLQELPANVDATFVTPSVAQKTLDYFVLEHGLCMAHHIRRVASATYNYHVRLGNVSENAFSVVRLPAEKDREVVWDLKDVHFLYHLAMQVARPFNMVTTELEARACAVGYLAYASAQRVSQIMKLSAHEIVDGGNKLQIKQSKRGAWVYVPLDDYAQNVINHYSTGKTFIFGTWTPQALAKAFARVRSKTGLDPAYQLRDLRRTRLVEMFDRGCTDAEAMAFSGHVNADSLKPYRQLWGRATSPAAANAFTKLNGG